MLRKWLRMIWGEPEPDPVLQVMERMVASQEAQAKLFESQIGLFEKWLAMFNAQPAQGADTDAQEQEMRDMIALQARMGNDDAMDLMRDEAALETYIRLARQSQ
jgi:hypothetical protein